MFLGSGVEVEPWGKNMLDICQMTMCIDWSSIDSAWEKYKSWPMLYSIVPRQTLGPFDMNRRFLWSRGVCDCRPVYWLFNALSEYGRKRFQPQAHWIIPSEATLVLNLWRLRLSKAHQVFIYNLVAHWNISANSLELHHSQHMSASNIAFVILQKSMGKWQLIISVTTGNNCIISSRYSSEGVNVSFMGLLCNVYHYSTIHCQY